MDRDWTKRFYKSKVWQKKRIFILQRDNYLCQECKRKGKINIANTVHHVKHLEDYPLIALDDTNLESVCASCHNMLHPERNKTSINKPVINNVRIIKI